MPKLSFEWEPEGFKELEKFKKSMESLAKASAEYGYFGNEAHGDGDLTNAELMYILSIGTDDGRIPPRNIFLGAGLDLKGSGSSTVLSKPVKGLMIAAAKNSPLEDDLEAVGEAMKVHTQSKFGKSGSIGGETILRNAKSTIRLKGLNAPLIEDGELVDAMEARATKGGK